MARAQLGAEQGGVLVMTAVWLPVLLLFASFVIDVGNFFEHQRHLQTQVDAGALAGGDVYQFPCDNTAITNAVRSYSGAQWNPQVANSQGSVTVLVNSTSYANQGGTDFSDGTPCSDGYVDVKATEHDVPFFFKILSLFGGPTSVPAINAHARVSILQEQTAAGALPIAVPDPTPQDVWAQFVNEDTGANIGGLVPLQQNGTDANGNPIWDNSGAPDSVTIPAPQGGATVSRIGVRTVISGSGDSTCGDVLVECDDQSSQNGILFAEGWCGPTTTPACAARSGTVAPVVRDVSISERNACDSYANAAFVNSTSTCNVKVRAKLDIGGLSASSLQVFAQGGNCPMNGQNHGCQMQFQTTGPDAGYWTTTGTGTFPDVGMASASGPNPVSLYWQYPVNGVSIAPYGACTNKNTNPCHDVIANVQRSFQATQTRSGVVQAASLMEGGLNTTGTFAVGSTHNFVVRLSLQPGLANATSVSSPPVALRVVGSQNQSIDCDPAVPNLRNEIAQGCQPQYTINLSAPCPSYASLWNTPQPWFCVKTQTGGSVGQVTQGMDDRILQGGSCAQHPNNWSMFPNLPSGDTRIVPMFVTPFGSFNGSGNDVIHVVNFATFYVTGWGHNGNGNGCPGDDPAPSGFIVGHFIKYVSSINTGGGTTTCQQNAFGSCVAVLTQ